MIKISRNFCRLSCLLNYYSYFILKDIESNNDFLKDSFHKTLHESIYNVLAIYNAVNVLIDVFDDNTFVKKLLLKEDVKSLCCNDIFKECVDTFRIATIDNIDVIKFILNILENTISEDSNLADITRHIAENREITNSLNINDIFYTNQFYNIFNQINSNFNNETFNEILNINNLNVNSNDFCNKILECFAKNEEILRKDIDGVAEKWSEKRIHIIEKIIIGLAISEYKSFKTPIQVVVNEYINLAKDFCGNKSGMFVNGLLDPLLQNQKF